jgi:hypothetical protein
VTWLAWRQFRVNALLDACLVDGLRRVGAAGEKFAACARSRGALRAISRSCSARAKPSSAAFETSRRFPRSKRPLPLPLMPACVRSFWSDEGADVAVDTEQG